MPGRRNIAFRGVPRRSDALLSGDRGSDRSRRQPACSRDALDPRYAIALARPRDVASLPAIERAAGELFRGHVSATLLTTTTDESHLREAQAAGLLWVALLDDAPIGFALVEMLADDLPHLEEIDVHPRHGRRGVGAALVRAVCTWASRAGHAELTLTTFRDIPWNMPFYARMGFAELVDLRPELARVVREETARGLDPAARVVMRIRLRAVPPDAPAA